MNMPTMMLRLAVLFCLLSAVACSIVAFRPSLGYTVQASQVYARPAGEALQADVYIPDGTGPFPAVVVIHGGGWVGGEREDMRRVSELLVAYGLVVMNMDYRSARQYPHPAQLEDCRAAVRWLRQHAEQFRVKPEQLAALGYSAGGHLALMLGLSDAPEQEEISSRVGAVVSGAGPTNLLEYPDSGMVKRLMGGKRITGRGQLWAEASPITHVSADDPPVLFYHGRWDMVVKLRQSQVLAKALEQANVEVEVDVQPFGHALTHVLSAGAIDHAARFIKEKVSAGN